MLVTRKCREVRGRKTLKVTVGVSRRPQESARFGERDVGARHRLEEHMNGAKRGALYHNRQKTATAIPGRVGALAPAKLVDRRQFFARWVTNIIAHCSRGRGTLRQSRGKRWPEKPGPSPRERT